jgi:hypothetical protein
VTYFKDPDSLSGQLWKRVLDIEREIAWDVYMLYSAQAEWKADPPQPDYWMHRLWGVTKAPHFEQATFAAKLKEMIDQADASKTTQGKNSKMKIEFLYFRQCPAHRQALENLRAALLKSKLQADLTLINITSEKQAEAVGFQGSPSIRVNGKDLDGRDDGYAFSCRVYQIGGRMTGTPTTEYIIEKLAHYR